MPAAPFLIAEVLASNIGGTATLVGDPPNIIIASRAGSDLQRLPGPPRPVVVVLMRPVRGHVPRGCSATPSSTDRTGSAEVMACDEREAHPRPAACWSARLIVLALVIAAFVLHAVLHYEPSVVALLGAGLLLAARRPRPPRPFLREIEWPTLAFFAGLFIMVGALIKTGVIGQLAEAVADATGGSLWLASMLLLWVLRGCCPASSTTSPMWPPWPRSPPTWSRSRKASGADDVLWWALALGADLGGNATAIGASANVVILGIAERNRPAHQLLGVHQVRPDRRGRDHAGLHALSVAALLHLRLTIPPHQISEAAQASTPRPHRQGTLPRAAGDNSVACSAMTGQRSDPLQYPSSPGLTGAGQNKVRRGGLAQQAASQESARMPILAGSTRCPEPCRRPDRQQEGHREAASSDPC